MEQFIQVGEMAFNISQIQIIRMGAGKVNLWFQGHPETDGPTELTGADAEAFLRWWNSYSGVIRIDQEPTADAKRIVGPDWDDPKYHSPGPKQLFTTEAG